MKKIWNALAVLFVLAAVGMEFAGCANETSASNDNPFIGTWVTPQPISDGGTTVWFRYVFNDSTVTAYDSTDNILWNQGYTADYSWNGNTCRLSTGYSGTISGGKLYFKFGDINVEFIKQ